MTAPRRSLADGPVLVTGGTGFLGRAVVQQLVASGVETHVLARESSSRGPLETLPVAWHTGDLQDAKSLEAAFSSLERSARHAGTLPRVVHSAALISYRSRDRELSREINVRGTERLLELSRRHSVSRFVHVSSVVTIAQCTGASAATEAADFNLGRLGVAYVDTKREAETLALAAGSALDVVVVNPGAIFGPVERTSNTVRLIRRMASGRPPPLVPPGSVGVLGVRDAARGTLLALERGRRGERYLLVESNLPIAELFRLIARHLGVPPPGRVLSRPAWRILTQFAGAWDRVLPIPLTPPEALKMLGLDLRFDASKARHELGWSPEAFETVLAETIEHVRSRDEGADG